MKTLLQFVGIILATFAGNSLYAQTYNYTGGMQTYVVPAGVTTITVECWGAQGGGDSLASAPGGYGGYVTADVAVTPGQTVNIYVGGEGIYGGVGGYNGGGDGVGDVSNKGGGGGGASDIRIGGTTLMDRIVVAGGGGGGTVNAQPGAGGAGGDLTGADGVIAYNGWNCTNLTVATGGTQAAGGIGGVSTSCAWNGSDGTFGIGGDSYFQYACAGGGGGWYGGGGAHNGGTGGGGSSYTIPAATNVTHIQGDHIGNGMVVITNACNATSILTDVAQLAPATDQCSVTVSVAPTATNDCGLVVDGVPDLTFPITTQGTTQITWTYDDGLGNVTTQTQDVVIADTTAPLADLVQLPDLNDQCQVMSLTPPTATDNCGGTITGTTTTTAPITTPGTTMITWTFDDGNGNISTQDQTVLNPIIDVTVDVTGTTIQSNQLVAGYQWVDCDNAFAPINGEMNQSYTPTVTGNYAVEINVIGCVDTSACTLIDFAGIDELTQGKKELIRIVDFMGRETRFKANTPLIYIYSDGTRERVFEVE